APYMASGAARAPAGSRGTATAPVLRARKEAEPVKECPLKTPGFSGDPGGTWALFRKVSAIERLDDGPAGASGTILAALTKEMQT
ncbi:MAG: hypothetical protein ACREFY_21475, partial [Acetobacteraceae bacterium]